MNNLAATIQTRLETHFSPSQLTLIDDSAAHAGHAGAQAGGRHFQLQITSAAFSGKSRLNRHRLIYALLQDLMPQPIHALQINAFAPEENC